MPAPRVEGKREAAERPGKAPAKPLRPSLRSASPLGGVKDAATYNKKQPLRNLSSRAVGLFWGNYLFSGRTISRMTLTMFSAERP